MTALKCVLKNVNTEGKKKKENEGLFSAVGAAVG